MGGKSATAEPGGEGDSLLAILNQRMRRVAEETFRQLSATNEAGAVKVKTAAAMLDMCETRVRTLIAEGKLKVIRPTPNTLRVTRAEIRRYLDEQSSEGQR